jgi:hypothetical protein
MYTVLMREGTGWRQYMVVSDGRVAIVHMTPAIIAGWNFSRVEKQGSADWPNMSREAIVAWKLANDDGLTRIVADLDSGFRARLIARATED